MRQVNMGTLQKQLKKGIYSTYLQHSDIYGMKRKPSVEISGKISGMSWVVVTLNLLKPKHMCSKEDYITSCPVYDEDDAAKIYDDLVNRRQWAPGYPYNEMPVSDEMREICEQIEQYVYFKVQDIFDSFTVQIAVVFNTEKELEDPWKKENAALRKWLKEEHQTTPKEWEETGRYLAGERNFTKNDWRVSEPLD